MNILKNVILGLLFFASLFFGYKVISESKLSQKLKADYAEINHFKYGLFSVNAWKARVFSVVSQEIDNLALTKEDEKVVKQQLVTQLKVLIDKVFEKIEKDNYDSPQGQIKMGLFNSFVDIDEIKKGAPQYADAILLELKKSRTQSQIKEMMKTKIDFYLSKTFDAFDDTARRNILKRTQSKTINEAKRKLDDGILAKRDEVRKYALLLIVTAVLIFLMESFNKKPLQQIPYFALTATLLVLLACGVTTPMIDMEAKITNFKFILFEQPIEFKDQILYFQTKSIQDVFWVMITHKELEMKLVGILMVCFSIVFPVFKILSSLAYYYDYCRARTYKIVQFFVLKSGKWSMADVLVVAIFMAYIGFNGIINSQMADLRSATESLNVMTTNGTNLQPGFYLFLTYTILAMFLSGFLKARPYACEPVKVDLKDEKSDEPAANLPGASLPEAQYGKEDSNEV